jgi:hypothetical protein
VPKRETTTERTCIVSREVLPADALIRFVVAPDGAVVPDLRRRLPGRGVWVTATAQKVAEAEKRRLITRGLDGGAHLAPGLAARVDRLLADAALSALSLARKAGNFVSGFAKVEAALTEGRAVALLHAADAGDDGVAKLAAVATRVAGDRAKPPVFRCFLGEELDLALGLPNVVHAALLAGPAGGNALVRVGELVRYRGGDIRSIAPSGRLSMPLLESVNGSNGAIELPMGKHD